MEEVLNLLTSKVDGSVAIFPQLRDALVFAAAVGFAHGRKLPFKDTSEPIRWDVASNRRGTELLVNLLAIAENPDDPEVMNDDRFNERILIFEEYANGGLTLLKEQLDSTPRNPTEVVLHLIEEAQRQGARQEQPALDDLLDELL